MFVYEKSAVARSKEKTDCGQDGRIGLVYSIARQVCIETSYDFCFPLLRFALLSHPAPEMDRSNPSHTVLYKQGINRDIQGEIHHHVLPFLNPPTTRSVSVPPLPSPSHPIPSPVTGPSSIISHALPIPIHAAAAAFSCIASRPNVRCARAGSRAVVFDLEPGRRRDVDGDRAVRRGV